MSVLLGAGPLVNKFEQVSSDDHQMSVVGDGVPRSHVEEGGEVTLPCELSSDAFDVNCYL